MEFKLKPFSKNIFPKTAVLICNASPRFWLQEIQRMGFILKNVSVFPVPSLVANELYGCLVVFSTIPKAMDVGRNIYFQNIHNKLFIPENTIVSPLISPLEMEQVFSKNYHVFHNIFGLVELNNEVNWLEILTEVVEVSAEIIIPAKSISIPKSITSLRIEVDEQAILKQLDTPELEQAFLDNLPFDLKKVLNGNQKEIDKFLSYLDKHPEMALQLGIPLDVMNTSRGDLSGKFSFGKNGSKWLDISKIFGNRKSNTSYNSSGSGGGFGSGFFGNLDSDSFKSGRYIFFKILFFLFLFSKLVTTISIVSVLKWLVVIAIAVGIIYFIFKITSTDSQDNYTQPIKYSNNTSSPAASYNTNKKSTSDNYFTVFIVVILVGLSFLFVKFIMSDSVDRSISPIFYIIGFLILALFVVFLAVMLFNFLADSFSNSSSSRMNSGNAALLDSERFSSLHKKYEDLAQDFISKKEYEKAAHVYLKLLQNKPKAAEVLESGKMYQEAAIVYLKHCQNKSKAAECYENGKAYSEAIALYKEFNMTEKVGDLYILMHQKKSADEYFYKVVDEYMLNSQYVKASLILRNKVGTISKAQEMLLDGWRSNKDAENCLNNYFYNIENEKQLKNEITRVYNQETSDSNLENFLTVIKKEFEKSDNLKVLTKEIAYEIVAKRIDKNPQIASELISFNKLDKNITKDIMKFKFNIKSLKSKNHE